jgi:signal transduction histidine kinase
MTFTIRHIATRLALILGVAAVLPLLAYGFVSLWSLERSTRESVATGNQNVAARAADELERYVSSHAEILKALGADLQDTGLKPWQQDRIVKNYILQFREFREITLFDQAGSVVATSRIGPPRVTIPSDPSRPIQNVRVSPIRVDDDLLPTMSFAVQLERLNAPAGWLVGEMSLEEMWRMVDQIRVGSHGFALVVGPDGTLVAHGNPNKKALVAQSHKMTGHPLLSPSSATPGGPGWREYDNESGQAALGVASAISSLGWTVIVEQATAEAYGSAIALRRLLSIAIVLAVLTMVLAGWFFGRRFIAPIFTLQGATHMLAEGKLDTRVAIDTGDEFQALGASFNAMADRLVELQEDVKRQERQAMFGRVAAGLVHDLSHPIQNIGNSARLLLRDGLDKESRDLFHRTIDRELNTLKRFMEDLRNVVRPKPVERFPMDVNQSVADTLESMVGEGARSGVTVEAVYGDGPLTIDGDRFALGRVYRNLITNGIQATSPGGRVSVLTSRVGNRVEVVVTDTGSGIPAERLSAIFDEFVTTKRRGLGLGLAICKRIVEQLDGTISVKSEVGRGTAFTMRFPARESVPAQAAS